ncbi:MAG: cupin domain-containing protein [Halolamina sp.]
MSENQDQQPSPNAAPDRAALGDFDADPHDRPFVDGEPEVVALSLSAGESVPAHSHPDRVVVCHVLDGELTLRFDGEAHDAAAGDLVRFDGDRAVSPLSRTDCETLLVLARR